MAIGDPGKEQFERAVTKLRNLSVVAAMGYLFVFRQEALANDEFASRSGFDNNTRDHFLRLLKRADQMRRAITHNPTSEDLGDLIDKAIGLSQDMTPVVGGVASDGKTAGKDSIQGQSRGLFALPFALDGSDPNIRLASKTQLKSPMSITILSAIDACIVNWTRLASAERSKGITKEDSMRIYTDYLGILDWLVMFGGDANRMDVANLLPSDEPQGPESSPNWKTEKVVGVAAIT